MLQDRGVAWSPAITLQLGVILPDRRHSRPAGAAARVLPRRYCLPHTVCLPDKRSITPYEQRIPQIERARAPAGAQLGRLARGLGAGEPGSRASSKSGCRHTGVVDAVLRYVVALEGGLVLLNGWLGISLPATGVKRPACDRTLALRNARRSPLVQPTFQCATGPQDPVRGRPHLS